MRIILWSDLHRDGYDFKLSQFTPEQKALFADCTLVIAGDLVSDYKSMVLDFLEGVSNIFKHVIYVFGNHEYWYDDIYAPEKLQEEIATIQWTKHILKNVHVLEEDMIVLDDVTFIGGTLWTSLKDNSFIAVQESFKCMYDYQLIKYDRTARPARTMTPQLWMALHESCVKSIEGYLHDIPDTSKVVVVTHHAPSEKSVHEKYAGDPLNESFYTDLEGLINLFSEKFAKWHWFHGHVHTNFDYTVGTCRVVCNPRGYVHRQTAIPENQDFNPFLEIEV